MTVLSVAAFLLTAVPFVPNVEGQKREGMMTAGIRTTPPAPVFDDTARRAELAERRARVAKEIGANGMLVMFSAEPRIYTNDVDYEYRQENNFYYLTHLKQKGATLVIIPGNAAPREILFIPKRNPALETWNGYMYSAEDARRLSGISEIWEDKEFEPFMQAVRARQPYRPKEGGVLMSSSLSSNATATVASSNEFEPLFGAIGRNEASIFLLVPTQEAEKGEFGVHREWGQEQRYATDWKKTANGLKIRSAFPILANLRLRKTPSEIQRLQHAIDITTEAFGRAMATAGRAKMEYEVEAEVEYIFKRRNADYWGYPSIVGCGPNATTLHYQDSQASVTPGSLLLMDVGAEYDHYTADITRTLPVNGKFTPAQADIYNIVLAAQEAGFNASRPGSTRGAVHDAAAEVIKDGLLRLGLITDKKSDQYRIWFMHGTTHWLGMNVHDVGGGRDQKLEPGMVYTNEPGIYIRADALQYLPKTPEMEKFIAAVRPAFEKYKTIGVRIEDDVLITPDGHRNLSAALPRTIPDIEAFIARASREIRLTSLGRSYVESAFSGQRVATPRGFSFIGTADAYARREHAHDGH